MDLTKMRPGQRLAAKEAYSDTSMLTNATQRSEKSSVRVVLTPVLAQRKPRGGTVKFTPTAPASPKSSGLGTGLFGFGTKKSGTVLLSGPGSMRRAARTDSKTVFVPGAMGSLGARIVRELLKSGFRVRAGCASVSEAQRDLDVGLRYGLIASDQSRNVSFAEVDWSSEESITAALGNSGKVVFTGDGVPSRACNALIALCEQQNVSQFVMVTSSGGSFFGGSSLKQAQSALESGNMSFTVVQTGNIDRTSDSVGTQNIVVGKGTGTLSKLQLAEFVAGCCINEGLAENKVLDIKADPFAENIPIGNLLSQIDPVITKEDQMAKQREKQETLDAIAVLVEKAQRLEDEETDCKERVNAFKDKIRDIQAAQKAQQRDAAAMLRSSTQIEKQLTTLTKRANDLDKQEAVAKELYTAAQKAGRDGQLLSREEQRDIEFAIMNQELIQKREAEEAERKRKQAEVEAAKAKALQEQQERLAKEKKKQEQEQKLAEAKAKAEKEAKAKAALEAKAKATAEAQKKAAAAAAAAKEKQRLAVEAKKKEEAERKAAEEKRRMEAKAAEEQRKRIEAEAKAKQEAKKKQEEEKKKLELEAKKKEEAKKAEAAKAKEAAETSAQPRGLFGFFAPKDETTPPTLAVESEPVDEIRPSAQEWISEWRASQKGEGASGWYENWIKRQSSSKAK